MKFTIGFAMLALPLLAIAGPLVERSPAPACNGGSIQCCNSVQDAHNPEVASLLGVLGILQSLVSGPVGVTCTPLVPILAAGGKCGQETACCTGNNFSGTVVLGCNAISL